MSCCCLHRACGVWGSAGRKVGVCCELVGSPAHRRCRWWCGTGLPAARRPGMSSRRGSSCRQAHGKRRDWAGCRSGSTESLCGYLHCEALGQDGHEALDRSVAVVVDCLVGDLASQRWRQGRAESLFEGTSDSFDCGRIVSLCGARYPSVELRPVRSPVGGSDVECTHHVVTVRTEAWVSLRTRWGTPVNSAAPDPGHGMADPLGADAVRGSTALGRELVAGVSVVPDSGGDGRVVSRDRGLRRWWEW